MISLKFNKMVLIFILIGLLNPMNFNSASVEQISPNFELTQEIPNIVISSIVLSNSLPEEGEEIIATVIVENQDSEEYTNLLIQISLIQEEDGPDEGGEDIMVGNEIINSLSAQNSVTIDITFMAPAGLYDVSAIIVYNNLPILDSERSTSLQVKSPKIGDVQTLIIAIFVLVLFFVVILLGQAIYDAIKLKSIILETNSNN